MKKVLFASTALVAAGMMMTAGTASASEKIKLNLGGFSKWWVVGAWQEDSYEANTGTGAGTSYANVDIKGDNEIFFGGSTTLDNGMKVGIDIQLEGNSAGDQIDESYIFVETGFGKFIVGSENNGAYLLHVMAPDAAGNWGEGGVMMGDNAIARPDNISRIGPVQAGNTTAILSGGDSEGITYVAPTFYGLTVGGSYIPNANSEDGQGTVASLPAYGVGALYANTFAGVGVKVSAGWVTYDAGLSYEEINEYSAGTQLSYAGFTLGGSYRRVSENLAGWYVPNANSGFVTVSQEGDAYDVGLQYANGPYAVSVAYFRSQVESNIAIAEDDTITAYQLSGKYALGPGVDVLASVGHIDYDDERADTAANADSHNKGWTVMTGMGLSF